MFSTNLYHNPTRKQLRSFGLVLAGGFLVIAFWPTVFRQEDPSRWAVIISAISAAAGFLTPMALRRPYGIWMRFGDWLGWINSKVILSALYYTLVTPVRVFMAFAGHDPMNRRFEATRSTYRVVRKERPASHMTHQF